jgi:hypothetical protein
VAELMPSLEEDFGVYEQPAQAERRRRQVAAQLSAPVALPGVSSRCVLLGQHADLRAFGFMSEMFEEHGLHGDILV